MQANTTTILKEIAQLPAAERESVRTILNLQAVTASAPAPPNGFIPPFDTSDSALSLQWMAEHRAEFAGQYVALDGDRLLAHGAEPQPVIAAVRASGLNGLLFTYPQPLDAPPFAGF